MSAPPEERTTLEDGTAGAARWAAAAIPRSVAELRTRALEFARDAGADDDVMAAVRLAVSEAVTNAVMHAFVDRETGTVTLSGEAGPGQLRFQVTDDGRGMQPRTDSPGLGFGLSTIGRLVQRLDVRAGPGGAGTTVLLVFRAPGVRGSGRVSREDPVGRVLLGASDLARSAAWPDDGFGRLAQLVLPFAADASCVDLVEDGTLRRLAAAVAGDPVLTQRLRDQQPPVKPGTATWAVLHGEGTRLVIHDPAVERSAGGPGAMLGLGWWLAVPLAAADGRVLAIWGLGGRGDRPPPDEATVALVEEAAQRAAGGLAHSQVLATLQDTRRRLESVLSTLSEAVCVTGPGGTIVYANAAAVRMFGAPGADELVGAAATDWIDRVLITDADGRPLAAEDLAYAQAHRGEAPGPVVTRSVDRQTGRATWLRTTARPLVGADDGLVCTVVEDISEVVLSEQRSQAMLRVGELLEHPADPEAALHEIAALLAPALADGCAIERLDARGVLVGAALVHPDPEQHARIARVQRAWPGSAEPLVRASLLAAAPRVVRVDDALLRQRAVDAEHLELMRAIGLRAVVVAPMRAAGRTLGLLTLAHDRASVRTFDRADVAFAEDVARRIATALVLAERPG